MSLLRYLSCGSALLAGAIAPGFAADSAPPGPSPWAIFRLKALQANPDLQLTVSTDMASYGRELPDVSPQSPMYFVARSEGFRPMGGAVAGEKPPMPAELEEYMFKALAARGFRPAADQGPAPRLALIYYWGSSNIGTEDPEGFQDLLEFETVQRAMLVGGRKFAHRVMESINTKHIPGGVPSARDMAPEVQHLFQHMNQDLYYVVVSAYSYDDLARNVRRLAWRTTMTVGAAGLAMRTAMPALVASAGEYFGRETTDPVMIRRTAREGTVTLAPLKILPDDEPDKRSAAPDAK